MHKHIPSHNIFGNIEREKVPKISFKRVFRNCLLASTALVIAFTAGCQATTVDPKIQIKADLDKGKSVLPFSPETYCSGQIVLRDPLGHEFTIPERCGSNYTFTESKIDFLPADLLGNYGMEKHKTTQTGDTFSGNETMTYSSLQILINPKIANNPCMEEIIVRKEAWENAGVNSALEKFGIARLFLSVNAGDSYAPEGLNRLYDFAAVNESLLTTPNMATCFANDSDMQRQLYYTRNNSSLAELTSDGIFNTNDSLQFIDSIMLFNINQPQSFIKEMTQLRKYLANN